MIKCTLPDNKIQFLGLNSISRIDQNEDGGLTVLLARNSEGKRRKLAIKDFSLIEAGTNYS